ncbi:unnamed protein product [Protopolystoma xenopodis]|uniref:Uncharacterized protein n=1 Tax=Protopolystoma xenopodis TaxID=117903 RepID=A0A3S5B2A0_9PLAT|nr:unnamed protein product [Protopolystoma xenopodis]
MSSFSHPQLAPPPYSPIPPPSFFFSFLILHFLFLVGHCCHPLQKIIWLSLNKKKEKKKERNKKKGEQEREEEEKEEEKKGNMGMKLLFRPAEHAVHDIVLPVFFSSRSPSQLALTRFGHSRQNDLPSFPSSDNWAVVLTS